MYRPNHSIEEESLKDSYRAELYVLTENWESDLEFYGADIRFLHHLIGRYFLWITKTNNLRRVKELKVELFHLNKKVKELQEKLNKHRLLLGENPNSINAETITTENGRLRREMAQFVKSFRKNRKEVFKITDYLMAC